MTSSDSNRTNNNLRQLRLACTRQPKEVVETNSRPSVDAARDADVAAEVESAQQDTGDAETSTLDGKISKAKAQAERVVRSNDQVGVMRAPKLFLLCCLLLTCCA